MATDHSPALAFYQVVTDHAQPPAFYQLAAQLLAVLLIALFMQSRAFGPVLAFRLSGMITPNTPS